MKAEDRTIEVTAKKKMSSLRLADLIDQALHGASYWADSYRVLGTKRKLTPGEVILEGHVIEIHDTEEDNWHELTLPKFLRGISLTDNLDFDSYDMYDAETVLQRALFGREVYS